MSFFIADISTSICFDSAKAVLYSLVLFWWFSVSARANFFFFVLVNFLVLVFSRALTLGLLLLTDSVRTTFRVYILCVVIPYVVFVVIVLCRCVESPLC